MKTLPSDEEIDELLFKSGALRTSYNSQYESGYVVPFETLAKIVEQAFALGAAQALLNNNAVDPVLHGSKQAGNSIID